MSDRLSVDDLVTVQRKLFAVRTEWYNLGLELGQRVPILDSIAAKCSSDPSQCFRQVLTEWLKGINPPPTWQAMVKALKSPTVAQHQVAEQIQAELSPAPPMQPLSPLPLSPQSPQTSTSAQPHPNLLGPSSNEAGCAVEKQNYQMICGRFARLLRIVSSRLQSIISIDEFRLFVVNLFQPGDCIPDSSSINVIFCAITKNGLWDCVNYLPLKLIVEEFAAEDIQLSESVKQYEEARSGYMLCTKISHHIDMVSMSDSSDIDSDEQLEEKPAKYDARYYRKLSLKVKAKVTEMSMQYVIKLWESLASHYRLPSRTAILDSVHAKCILVTWLVPTKHTLELIEKARADPDFFQEHNVLWAKVDDDDYLYNSKREPAARSKRSATSSVTTHVRDTRRSMMEFEFPSTKEQNPGQPLVPLPVNDITNVTAGDHVLYHIGSDEYRKDYRSALVSEVNSKDNNMKIITFTRKGVEEKWVGFASLGRLHQVEYSTCCFTAEKALSRARWRQDMNEKLYNPIDNNGHFFVTNAKTGREHNLSDMIMDLKAQDTDPDPPTPFVYKYDSLKPVAFRQQVNSIADIQPGQHLLVEKQHLLVKSSNPDENEITAFKEEKGRIAETTMTFPPLKTPIFEITYEKELCPVQSADATLQKAEDAVLRAECTSKRHSSHFVTEMKTGTPLTVDESCLFSKDVAPTSLTPITSHMALDEGDHIAVEFEENQFNHGIVLRNMGPNGVLTIPNLSGDPTIPTGFIHPTTSGPRVFRVNYEQSVPADQTKERACNVKGNRILSEKGPEYFATWARTGKPMAVNMSQLKTKKAQLRHIHPLYLERVTSPNDIHVGDHLIQGYPTHWFHFLVAAKDPSDPSKVTCIYCLRTKVAECDITLDLQDKDVYRIQYPESFAPKGAIDRARSQVGKWKFRLDARMWFVRWAKTGSDEGIEVDFLDNHSLPLTKSTIRSFAQLNVGDAIVKKEKRSFAHYYLVTEVSSPYECEAIESYFGICKTTVKFDPQNESEVFYRLNYHPGACFLPGDSVKMASHLVENYKRTRQYFFKRLTSARFINFVKTGDSNPVDSDILKDDRPLCIRTVKVTSVDELLPGDHIRRPAGSPLPQGCFHHMMVAKKPEEDGSCSMFHYNGEKSVNKATLSQTREKIDGNEVYRICYPERIDPNVSLQFLQRVSQYRPGEDHSIPNKPNETDDDSEAQALFQDFVDQKKGHYWLPSNNCEHLIMFATAHVDLSLQIDEKLYTLLEYSSDIPLKFVLSPFLKLGQKVTQGIASNGVASSVRSVVIVDTATESISAASYMSTVRAISLATGTTFTFVASTVIDLPFFVRGLYKLHRKKKFNQIDEVTFKRGCAKQTTVSTGAVLGGTAGAVAGSFVPVPFLGTFLGGAAGAIVGIAAGHAVGYGVGFAFKEGMIPDFVIVHTHLYTDYP